MCLCVLLLLLSLLSCISCLHQLGDDDVGVGEVRLEENKAAEKIAKGMVFWHRDVKHGLEAGTDSHTLFSKKAVVQAKGVVLLVPCARVKKIA